MELLGRAEEGMRERRLQIASRFMAASISKYGTGTTSLSKEAEELAKKSFVYADALLKEHGKGMDMLEREYIRGWNVAVKSMDIVTKDK